MTQHDNGWHGSGRAIRRRRWLGLGGMVLLGSAARAADKPRLQLLTEDYPPLTFAERGEASGLGTALVREMLRRAGYDATIAVVPWARGYETARSTRNVGLFVTSRTAEREALFQWVGPMTTARAFLYARRSQLKVPQTIDEARHARFIAVPREWYLHQILRKEKFDNLSPVADPGTALRMLAHGRVELAALDESVLADTAAREGVPLDTFRPVVPMVEVKQYLAFSHDTDPAVAQDLQRALDAMRKDGTLARLYRQWLPGVAPPD